MKEIRTTSEPAEDQATTCDVTCKESGWMRQFGNPVGVVGSLIGHLMAIKNGPH
ncbi:MAG TPA: hypothetical protein VGK74_14920 [Symbiobacteriaceae bacterium]